MKQIYQLQNFNKWLCAQYKQNSGKTAQHYLYIGDERKQEKGKL